MKVDNALPVGQGWRRKLRPGFSWWLMPQNQSIGQCGSEIRSWTRWPEEASDLPTIHLCPHLVLLNVWHSVLPLNSPPLTKQADAISLSVQLGLLGHNTTPTLLSSSLCAAWRPWLIARDIEHIVLSLQLLWKCQDPKLNFSRDE